MPCYFSLYLFMYIGFFAVPLKIPGTIIRAFVLAVPFLECFSPDIYMVNSLKRLQIFADITFSVKPTSHTYFKFQPLTIPWQSQCNHLTPFSPKELTTL